VGFCWEDLKTSHFEDVDIVGGILLTFILLHGPVETGFVWQRIWTSDLYFGSAWDSIQYR